MCPIVKLIRIRNINDSGRIINLTTSIAMINGIIIFGDDGIIL